MLRRAGSPQVAAAVRSSAWLQARLLLWASLTHVRVHVQHVLTSQQAMRMLMLMLMLSPLVDGRTYLPRHQQAESHSCSSRSLAHSPHQQQHTNRGRCQRQWQQALQEATWVT